MLFRSYREIHNTRRAGLFIKKVDENGKPLSGATFELRRGSGEVLMREVTDQNGIIFRGYLTTDTYVVEEIKAPEGYLMDENNPQSIYISNQDDNKEFVLTFVNLKKPAIEVIKVDGKNPTIRLQGAVFRITNAHTNQYWDIQTGADGTALLENLEIGQTYIVEEINAPAGYVNSGYRQEIILKEARVHTLTIANEKKPSLTLVKKDASTGVLLSGATYRVSWNSDADFQDVTTNINGEAVITGLNVGWYTITEIKAPDGYLLNTDPIQILLKAGENAVIEVLNHAKPSLTLLKVDNVTKTPLQHARFRIEQKTESGNRLIGEHISDANGIVFLDNMLPGRYQITEIAAPDGFNIDVAVYEITIESGQAYRLEITNTPQSPIYVSKVDDKGNPLMGAQFKITTMNGAMVGTVTTGRTGYAIIPYAEPGWYVVEEVCAPDGYILSSTPVNVQVLSGRPAQVEFVNYKKPQLTILKLDSSDNTALMGARIRVAKDRKSVV